ncbi:MAG: glycosyltransferase [Caulobacter sp.]|nr:glycosyltransferase [Caulobacter sp.]
MTEVVQIHGPPAGTATDWLLITGIRDDLTGTGRFVQHIVDMLRRGDRTDVRLLWSRQGVRLPPGTMDEAVEAPALLLLHPQFLGMREVLDIIERRTERGRQTHYFVLDGSFFCVNSYNHLEGATQPCLHCLGGDVLAAGLAGCKSSPVDEPDAFGLVGRLRRLGAAGSVVFHCQSASQARLVRLHFGPGADVRVAGLWCRDWTAVFDHADRAPAPDTELFDVVYHGHVAQAKGLIWLIDLARHLPGLRFLVPAPPDMIRGELPGNLTVRPTSWESGLDDLVRKARFTAVPSLWSAPIEGSLAKSLAVARAVIAVDVPTAFANDLPEGLLARLSPDAGRAARELAELARADWHPDPDLKRHWIEEFRRFNGEVVTRLLPRRGAVPPAAAAVDDTLLSCRAGELAETAGRLRQFLPRRQPASLRVDGRSFAFGDLDELIGEIETVFGRGLYQVPASRPWPLLIDVGTGEGLLPFWSALVQPHWRALAFEGRPVPARRAAANLAGLGAGKAGDMVFVPKAGLDGAGLHPALAERLRDEERIELLRLAEPDAVAVLRLMGPALAKVDRVVVDRAPPGETGEMAALAILDEAGFECRLHMRHRGPAEEGFSPAVAPEDSRMLLFATRRALAAEPRTPRLLQVVNYYPAAIEDVYRRRPDLAGAPFARQIEALLDCGFNAAHNVAPALTRHGWETHFVVANAAAAQAAWLAEKGLPQQDSAGILLRQIEVLRPDVVYVGDTIALDGRFLRQAQYRPHLTVGWRASVIPQGVDWAGYDLMLSSHAGCREQALKLGAGASEPFWPGLPARLARAVEDEPKLFDVVFAGQVGSLHKRRLACLDHLVRSPAVREGRISVALYLAGGPIPEILAPYVRPSVWGMDLYRALRRGRISLNVHIDMYGGEAQNMRIFETLTAGGFLLTDHASNLAAMFEPGRELDSFESPEEMMEKIAYWLARPEERAEVARRGQQRCLAEHSMELRAAQFDAIMRRHLVRRDDEVATLEEKAEALLVRLDAEPAVAMRDELRQLLTAFPDEPAAYALYGVLALIHGQTKEAWQALRRAAVHRVTRPGLVLRIAGALVHMGDLEAARDLLSLAVRRRPGEVRLISALATVLMRTGLHAQAAARYETAIALGAGHLRPALAEALAACGRHGAANPREG